MEGLGVAANVIAVIDLSAKIASLCYQYSQQVARARADIERMRSQVDQLATVLREAQRLIGSPQGQPLSVSQRVTDSLRGCLVVLKGLEEKLVVRPGRSAMRRFGLRALKWPFSSKEVDQMIEGLEKHERAILLALQIDQTKILIDLQNAMEGIRLAGDKTAPRKAHFMMPFPRDPDFVNRPAIWSWIIDQYNGTAQRMALVGMGGFGKSQMIIQFAHHIHSELPETSIFWIRASTKATFEESCRSVADVLALPRRHEPSVNVPALLRDWLQRQDVGPWLILLDNADDMGVLHAEESTTDGDGEAPLASYLPKTSNGKILVTSRSWDVAERLTGSGKMILRINPMEESQSLLLLHRRLDQDLDEESALELVRALDNIPLAVNQAAAYIYKRRPRVTVQSYLDDFRRDVKHQGSLLRSDKGDLRRYEGVSNSVLVTWKTTFEQIQRERPSAANLISLMSCFQPQNIPEYMLCLYNDDLSSLDDPAFHVEDTVQPCDHDCLHKQMAEGVNIIADDAFEEDLELLFSYSMINPAGKPKHLDMHPLVRSCTQIWASESGNSERWRSLFIFILARHFPLTHGDPYGRCHAVLPHIQPLLDEMPSNKPDLFRWSYLLVMVGTNSMDTGDFSRGEYLLQRAIETRELILGETHCQTLLLKIRLIGVYGMKDQRHKGLQSGRATLAQCMEKLGQDHPLTAMCKINLALCESDKNPDQAAILAEDSLKWMRQYSGWDKAETQWAMEVLGLIYDGQHRWQEAEATWTELLKSRERSFGVGSIQALDTLSVLAHCYWYQGREEEAVKLREKVLAMRKENIAEDHVHTLFEIETLASEWESMSRFEDAITLQQDVVRLRQVKYGNDHPNTQASTRELLKMQRKATAHQTADI